MSNNLVFKMNRIRFYLVIIIGASIAINAHSYSSNCPQKAKKLKNAANEYEYAHSNLESEKNSYESACNSGWGFSRKDESACGVYGYKRSALDSAKSSLDYAESNLEAALKKVTRSCGNGPGPLNPQFVACIGKLNNKTIELQRCKNSIKPKQSKYDEQ